MSEPRSFVVRAWTERDQPQWADLREELWPGSGAEDPQHVTRIYVAEAPGGGPLVGFIELSLKPYANGCDHSPVGFVEGVFVAPMWRRQGLGAKLIAAASDWARAQGARELASDALLDNRRAHAAHVGWGFAETERVVCFVKPLKDPTGRTSR